MIKLNVWLTLPDGQLLQAGELVSATPAENGAITGQFRYHTSYLQHPDAFGLDPLHLPLQADLFSANRPKAGVHAVFEDSLPDDWGRRLLIRRFRIPRLKQRIPYLLKYQGAAGLGALGFGTAPFQPVSLKAGTHDLQQLLDRTEEFERDSAIDDDLTLLFEAGSSPGGARPKVVIEDKGISWLAKFPSFRDKFDMIALEAATMELARMTGIRTPVTKIMPCGANKQTLLVERFDLTQSNGRCHMVSMQTLTEAEGFYNLGYCDLADIIRKISSVPKQDLYQLFLQMIFNVVIGNTDDHLKNFCMLHDEQGWRLSPAFDLLPNVAMNREQQLHIDCQFQPTRGDALLREAPNFAIKHPPKARQIINNSINIIARSWQQVFTKFKVPQHDIDILNNDISNRITSLRLKK